MRAITRWFALTVSVSVSLAGGLSGCWSQPAAVGRPRAEHAVGADDGHPLVAARLEDDAAVGRALREYYTKFEYRIPMRDGVKLFTVAYVPKDASRPYPIMLHRTPYSVAPYGIDNYPAGRIAAVPAGFVREGFVFVFQDVRGALMSEGTFVDVRPHAATPTEIDESTDSWDTIDWLVKNIPNNNGRVGSWGISYPGFYSAQTVVSGHPALKAASPQAPVTEWFLGDDFHHNGAFFLADAFDFYATFGKPRPKPTTKVHWGYDRGGADVYDFFLAMGPLANANAKYLENKIPFWNELLAHPNRDAWWKARDPRPFYRTKDTAVLTVGGFFDNEDLYGALATYHAFEAQSPGADNALVMGPWHHGGWAGGAGDRHGDITFGQATATFYRDEIELPFFLKHLKGRGPGLAGTEAFIFETGVNVWRKYASWPPPGGSKQSLLFRANGQLGSTAGAEGSPGSKGAPLPLELPTASGQGDASAAARAGSDSYVSDPAHPVPYRATMAGEIDSNYMSGDQRFASRRTDVLTYATGELESDVSLAGPVEASLWVSTTATDADFVVKLIDAYPMDHADADPGPAAVRMGGYQQLVRGEVMRARFRESFERPVPFEPNKPALVTFTLPDVAHTFRTGHRLMVQVQSTWFPLVDRNPQTFLADIAKATEADFRNATHRVYHTPAMPSGLSVRVLRGTLPR